MKWLEDRTILLTMGGSRSYGTNTPTSDVDIKGVCIPPREYILGFLNCFEQCDGSEHIRGFRKYVPENLHGIIDATKLEGVIYDIRKFLRLATDCNPNILEILFCDDADVLKITPAGEKLRENRNLFLSKAARPRYQGYAMSQLGRIKTHRQYLLNPLTTPPTRESFGLTSRSPVSKEQLDSVNAMVQKQLDRWNDGGYIDELDESVKIRVREGISQFLQEIGVSQEQRELAVMTSLGLDDNLIRHLQAERAYGNAVKQWGQYQSWLQNRNPDRAAMEAKYGFDCYSSDTEFLTDAGWKRFDDITQEHKLATIFVPNDIAPAHRTHLGIEYQEPTERFDALYTGNMYQITGNHLDLLVTANHRMLARKRERRSGIVGSWELIEAAHLPDTFEFLHGITPKTKTFGTQCQFKDLPIPQDTYLRLMGWYLSDGCLLFAKSGRADEIRISQKKKGRLYGSMVRFARKYANLRSSLYHYDREPSSVRPYSIVESVLSVRDPVIVQRILSDCGHTDSKHIPRWVFDLSRRQMEILFDAMVLGDGTIRKTSKKSVIYYSCLTQIANDVNELAVLCGWETSVYGPYDNEFKGMYQVHVHKGNSQVRTLVRSSNVTRVPVKGHRVVCFSVPNGTLVVRRNGHVSYQGNCKHGMHLARLLLTCREILRDGVLKVRRDDAEFLLGIRNGMWTYDQLMEWSERIQAEIDELYKTSKLPKTADRVRVDALCQQLIEESLS